jgi:hypothetical protein
MKLYPPIYASPVFIPAAPGWSVVAANYRDDEADSIDRIEMQFDPVIGWSVQPRLKPHSHTPDDYSPLVLPVTSRGVEDPMMWQDPEGQFHHLDGITRSKDEAFEILRGYERSAQKCREAACAK